MTKQDTPNNLKGSVQINKEITLVDIWNKLKSIEKSVSIHDSHLTSIKNDISKFESILKSFSITVENLSSELAQVKKDKLILLEDMKGLREKVDRLENISPMHHQVDLNMIDEAQDRFRRAYNVIVLNLNDSADEHQQTANV